MLQISAPRIPAVLQSNLAMKVSLLVSVCLLSACASSPPLVVEEPEPRPSAADAQGSLEESRLILVLANVWGTAVEFELSEDELVTHFPDGTVLRTPRIAEAEPELAAAQKVLYETTSDSICGKLGRHTSSWLFVGRTGRRRIASVQARDEPCRRVQNAANAIARLAGAQCGRRSCGPARLMTERIPQSPRAE